MLSLEERKKTWLWSEFELCGKKLKPSIYVKYLGIYWDEYLNWSPHINHFSQKLVKAIAMLCKFRHFVNVATIKSIYYAIFYFDLSYVCTAWGQNLNSKYCINSLQKKVMRIISFAPFDAHITPIFAKLNIIKFPDLIPFCNCFFIYKYFLSKYSSVFYNVFILTSNTHEQNTRLASHGLLTKPSCSTSRYDANDFAASAMKFWNFFQKKFYNNSLCQLSYSPISNCWLRITFLILTIRNVVKN